MDFTVITEKRSALGISVSELCRRAGISRKVYYDLVRENGSCRVGSLERVLSALHLSDEEKIRLMS